MALGVAGLLAGYREGALDPAEVVERAYEQALHAEQPAWIALLGWREVRARLPGPRARSLPLYGVPFAVKDNIDVFGVPTTAACPAYAYSPRADADAVARLAAAGAVPIGKTNMDQFATGLTGTRTPFGACWSVFDSRYVAGGSSSGSAVAVADGTVPFALGTDTAGSGRVPAAFNGVVGMKPSRGLVSTGGVVPACWSLDCVSVFAGDVDGAARVLAAAAGHDGPACAARAAPRLAVPAELDFLGDAAAARAWALVLRVALARGWELVEVDFAPFAEAAAMLYTGPWLTERFAAVGAFIAGHRAKVDPVVAQVILSGGELSAVDADRARRRLARLQAAAWRTLDGVDALLVPTTPTIFTHAEIAEEPVARTSALGRHTNFANLLDLCAIALPGPDRSDGLPAGVTFLARAGADQRLVDLARRWEAADGRVVLAVVGAHLSGQPLNGQLRAGGAVLLETTRTGEDYRLFVLPGASPPKPGLVRQAGPAGAGIEVELWALGHDALGRVLAAVPPPLTLGTVALADGRTVKGFLCEPWAVRDAEDITGLGGWRAYLASSRAPSP